MKLRWMDFGMRSKTWLAVLVQLVAAMVLWPALANAQCSLGSGGTQKATITLSPSTVSIPRDAPVGTVLAQGSQSFTFNPAQPYGVWCSTSISGSYTSPYGASSGGIIPSGIPGLGFQMSHGGVTNQNTTTFTITQAQFGTGSSQGYVSLGTPVSVQLVKTGPVSGTVVSPAGLLMTMTIGTLTAGTVTLNNSVVVTGTTCLVTTPSLTVSLPTVTTTDFGIVGSTAGPTSFQIGLNCSGVAAKVGITFTDNTNPANTGTTLSPTSSSSATGVGIQILNAGNPVGYGPDSSVAGNPGQILLGSISNTITNLPFSARYVKTATNVTPGSVNGVATFTMTYQ